MSQSKISSLIESNLNTAFGFVLSTAAWHWLIPVIFPELKPHSGWGTAFGVTLVFTVISIARNYLIRRIFNKYEEYKDV